LGKSGNLFISVHNNSSTNPGVHGTELYAQVANASSLAMARRIHDSVVAHAGTTPRGVHRRVGEHGDYYAVLRNSMPTPAVIVEGAYVSNAAEARRLSQPDFRQRLADGIAEGVLSQFVTNTPKGPGPPAPASMLGNNVLAAPGGLGASVSGRDVHLSWQAVPFASFYEVWRDGNLLGSTGATSIDDRGVSFGGHHYDVRSVMAPAGLRTGESPASGFDVAMGKVVIDPGHGGSDSGAVGSF
jgi:N-acetylmuramoyl-L-alanine amidase